ncbi:rRNA maturation RNase YbeY [Robiginitalea sp. SC105]|uniref:rRNA maturation RNase YbeY n=1 Tax=Robiginitalea sp. SC105 TaxID=2762332 RepID=UPI00163B4A53|nr:rRNA maturation RNase YbeY [Robiginitalea sp. SC105]MBC2838210.1 rRNA maturation RNase YbeY [Robiginitalea sp. SC105]
MKIEYHSETDFQLLEPRKYTEWIKKVVASRGMYIEELSFIFCSDDYLLDMNQKYLGHDYFTDIITFPNAEGSGVGGDLFISVDRVRDNAREYGVDFDHELARVMIHGVLHLSGLNDKTAAEQQQMRKEEDRCLEMFHVKQ